MIQTIFRQILIIVGLLIALLPVAACGDDDDDGGGGSESSQRAVILATTTSTQDSGLLDVLVPAFERESGRQVKTVAVGSGEAIELGSRGEADVLLVHSPDAEEEFMATGRGGERLLVMHNDFVIVGPPDDPAGIRGMGSFYYLAFAVTAAGLEDVGVLWVTVTLVVVLSILIHGVSDTPTMRRLES